MTTPPPDPDTPRPRRSTVAVVAAVAIVLGALVSLGACILADPPAEVDPEVVRRPIILRESVQPSPTAILRTWPDVFVIPLETSPSATIYWVEYFDSVARPVQGRNDPSPANQDGGVRILRLPEDTPTLTDCHVFEVVFALGFGPNSIPTGPGGDSISWFYSPTGDLTSCPVFDASVLDASDAETGSE